MCVRWSVLTGSLLSYVGTIVCIYMQTWFTNQSQLMMMKISLFRPAIDISILSQTEARSSGLCRLVTLSNQMMGNHPSGPPPCLIHQAQDNFITPSDNIFVTLHTHTRITFHPSILTSGSGSGHQEPLHQMAMGGLKVSVWLDQRNSNWNWRVLPCK